MTPWVFWQRVKAWNDDRKDAHRMALFAAWHTVALGRMATLPQLKDLLADTPPEQSPEQLELAVEIIAANWPGARVIRGPAPSPGGTDAPADVRG